MANLNTTVTSAAIIDNLPRNINYGGWIAKKAAILLPPKIILNRFSFYFQKRQYKITTRIKDG